MAYELDTEQQRKWTDGYRALQEAEDLCRRLASCGFDVTERDLICQALRSRYEAVRREFFPKARD
jgi:hypothetical protein